MEIHKPVLEYFARYIAERLGIVYKEENFYQLEARLQDIIRQGGFESPNDLFEKAKAGRLGQFETLLLDVATNNETSFFRDPNIWQALKKNILDNDDFHARHNGRLRIWCAASSYGQEPYTLAMMLHEIAQMRPLHFSILATDISERALTAAKKGVYSQLQVQRGLPTTHLVKYFTKSGSDDNGLATWELKDEIKRLVSFRKLNLLEDWRAHGPFDLILCRNVLIYQNTDNKQKIISRLYEALNYDGYLVMGGAESLLGIKSNFQLVSSEGILLYGKQLETNGVRKVAS